MTAAQGLIYQGTRIVARSIEMGQPIVFVSVDHRLNFFGAMSAQEPNDDGVLKPLLKDQRVAMQWIQKYIGRIGGDKNRVTLFDETADSLTIVTHMDLNDGNNQGLFSGAIMGSGGIIKHYDYKREQKIAFLRKADYSKIYNRVQQLSNFSYTSAKVPWYPRPDGKYLVDSPRSLLRKGKVANILYFIGDMKDEGSLFSVVRPLNITNDAEYQEFCGPLHPMPDHRLLTGPIYRAQYLQRHRSTAQRLASLVGDITFESGRRNILQHTYNKQEVYTYQIEQSISLLGQLPVLGSLNALTNLPFLAPFHVSNVVLNDTGLVPSALSKNSLNVMSTYISFVNSQDPNNHELGLPHSPTWEPTKKSMFWDKENGPDMNRDDYGEKQMDFVNNDADTHRY